MCTIVAKAARSHVPDALLRFVTDADQISHARKATAGALAIWGLSVLVEDAELVLTELLGNARLHGGDLAVMTVTREERGAIIRIWDPSAELPERKKPDHLTESGRGLNIVAALSVEHGCYRTGSGGKVAWARLKIGS